MENSFDLVIIGAGPGGYTAAQRAGQLGMKTAVIDRGQLGGTGLYRGCISTKALMYASSLYEQMRGCGRFGLHAQGLSFSPADMHQYKTRTVEGFRERIAAAFTQYGVQLLKGDARVLGEGRVEWRAPGEAPRILEAGRILIAAGAQAIVPDIPGVDLPGVVTSGDLLADEEWGFKSLTVIGGGVVGIELATLFQALGYAVTIVEAAPRLLMAMDLEVSEALERILRKSGIRVYTGAQMREILRTPEGLSCRFAYEDRSKEAVSDKVLLSVGRAPCVEGLFGPDVDAPVLDGHVVVDRYFSTALPGVYAIGDVLGRIQLAHLAAAQGTYVVEVMNGLRPSIMLSTVPSCSFVELPIVPACIYIEPEIACVGISEGAAKRHGLSVRCGRCDMSRNGKTIISGMPEGFIKLIFESHTHMLVGAQMICARATDMIGELTTAIANGMTAEQLVYAMRPHPTYNEAVSEAVWNAGLIQKDRQFRGL